MKAKPRKQKGEKTPPPENETADQRMVRIMDDDFTVFDFTKVNHDAVIVVSTEPHVDLCEKVVFTLI